MGINTAKTKTYVKIKLYEKKKLTIQIYCHNKQGTLFPSFSSRKLLKL